MPITSKNYEGKEMILVYKSGVHVEVGDVVSTLTNDTVTVTGGHAPKSESSSGRVYVRESGLIPGMVHEYYPFVVLAHWRHV